MPGPLDGVKVVDVSAILSGPMATMLLADQGASVVKVEPPGLGDFMRLSPFRRGGQGAFFVNGNRGKRSIAMDLRKPEGREILLRLVKDADVFVQNFRPGAVDRLGIGESDLRAVNPDLVYVSISGFGQTGPYSDRRVYDPVIQALTGHVALQHHPDGGDVDLVRNVICDKASALLAAQAITAALYAREKGAGGQHVRLAMIDAGLAFFWPDGMMGHTFVGEGVQPGPMISDLYRLTPTADGHLVYFAATDSEFNGLFRALERPELCDDERYNTTEARVTHSAELQELILAAFRRFENAKIMQRLLDADVPVAPVHDLDAVLEDPQLKHNGSIIERDHGEAGIVREARPAAQFDRTPAELGRPAPHLGEHTDEILGEIGVSAEERASLRKAGVLPEA